MGPEKGIFGGNTNYMSASSHYLRITTLLNKSNYWSDAFPYWFEFSFQVAPAELEELLRTHPSVSDVAVIGVPSTRTGETPIAFIVQKKDMKLKDDDVKNFLSGKVSRHKEVSEVFFIDSIPRSASGKILRKDLKQTYVKDHQLS